MSAQNIPPTTSGVPAAKQSRSLRTIIILAFLGVGGVILTVNSALNLYFNYTKEQSLIASSQTLIAKNAESEVKGFIDEKFQIIEQAAYVNDLIDTPADREIVLNKLIGHIPSFRQLVLIDNRGTRLYKVSRLSSFESVQEQIAAHLSAILSEVKKKNNYISETYIDPSTQEPIIIIAVPVKNVFGDVEGALIAEVNLKFMWDLVGSLKIGNGGLAYVVDNKGNLIAFGDVSRVLKRENLNNLKEVKEFIEDPDAGDRDSGVGIVKGIQGEYVVSNFVSMGSPEWAVVVEMPIAEAYRPLILETLLSLLVLVGSSLLGMVVTILLSRQITKPIIKLTAAVQKIKEGNLETEIEVGSRDEIGELASVFNQMTRELRQLYANLEQKIEERTKSLDQKIKDLEKFNELTVGRELKMIEMKKEIADLRKKVSIS
jgi:methyl-accepting chemotaxis protein